MGDSRMAPRWQMPPLAVQIGIGLLLGVVAGSLLYGNAAFQDVLKPVGDIFIRLIKMIVVPIVFSTLVVGVSSLGDVKRVGRLGVKTLIYFEIVTTLAILFGVAIANLTQPGAGVAVAALSKSDISKYAATAQGISQHPFADLLTSVVPANVVDSLARGDMLPVIFFAVFFGLGVAALGERGTPIVTFFRAVADTMFWVTNQIMRVAPIGVFALVGITASKFGLASMLPLAKLVGVVYVAMALFVVIVLGAIAWIAGIRLWRLIGFIRAELVLAFGTASSESVLARIIEKMEAIGCPDYIAGIVIPTGYTFNLDGSTLYQSIAALFVAQLYGIHLGLGQQLLLVATLALTSKGIAGVPGASLVVLLAVFTTLGLPLEGVAYVAGVDRILDMARTAVNVCGNSLAAVVISRSEGVTFAPPLARAQGHTTTSIGPPVSG